MQCSANDRRICTVIFGRTCDSISDLIDLAYISTAPILIDVYEPGTGKDDRALMGPQIVLLGNTERDHLNHIEPMRWLMVDGFCLTMTIAATTETV